MDNTLTATPRTQIVSSSRQHHKNAASYQQLDSDRVRYKVFEAYNRYLSRLIQAARHAQLQPHFELYLKDYSVNLITEHHTLATYFSRSGRIGQFVLDTENGGKLNIRSPTPLMLEFVSQKQRQLKFYFVFEIIKRAANAAPIGHTIFGFVA